MNVDLNSVWSYKYVIIAKIQKMEYINSIFILTYWCASFPFYPHLPLLLAIVLNTPKTDIWKKMENLGSSTWGNA